MTNGVFCPECGNQMRLPDFATKQTITDNYSIEKQCIKCRSLWEIVWERKTGFEIKCIKLSTYKMKKKTFIVKIETDTNIDDTEISSILSSFDIKNTIREIKSK